MLAVQRGVEALESQQRDAAVVAQMWPRETPALHQHEGAVRRSASAVQSGYQLPTVTQVVLQRVPVWRRYENDCYSSRESITAVQRASWVETVSQTQDLNCFAWDEMGSQSDGRSRLPCFWREQEGR